MTGSRVKGGTPIKILDTPPRLLNARTDLPRPLLRPLTQRTTPANWLPPSSGLGNRLADRSTPCFFEQVLAFHVFTGRRHRNTQNPPTLLNTHLGYSQELWNVLNVLFTFSVSDSNDGSHLRRTLFHIPVYVSPLPLVYAFHSPHSCYA